jgi:hypothetical protein
LVQFGIERQQVVLLHWHVNVTLASLVDVTSGTLDAGSFTIAQDPSDPGTLLVHDNATLKVGGTNTLPAFTTYDLDSLSTVEYHGGVQAIAAARLTAI